MKMTKIASLNEAYNNYECKNLQAQNSSEKFILHFLKIETKFSMRKYIENFVSIFFSK